MAQEIKKVIAGTFLEMADALQTGEFGKKPVIGIAAEGGEHGEDTILEAVAMAEKRGCKAVVVGGDCVHKLMEEMLEKGELDAVVTMHYPFPIGVSTVGRVITPAQGKELFLATTTGTSATDRVEGLIKNAIYGIISAKGSGIENPTVGIANIDGARQAEKALLELKENGYDINFAESARADGGIVMRGNDLLQGSADIMVMDPLTGNLMMKMFSAFNTGGGYEATGYGYGPGIGEGYEKLVMIVSRASGAPVIAGAIEYATQLVKNNVFAIAKDEFAKAKKAGLDKIIAAAKPVKKAEVEEVEVKAPPKVVVDHEIPGIEVMDLEDAVTSLWAKDIYAESGMGCTGPVVMIPNEKTEEAVAILKEGGYM